MADRATDANSRRAHLVLADLLLERAFARTADNDAPHGLAAGTGRPTATIIPFPVRNAA